MLNESTMNLTFIFDSLFITRIPKTELSNRAPNSRRWLREHEHRDYGNTMDSVDLFEKEKVV